MDICELDALELAYIGDGVYELMVREYLLRQGVRRIGELHARAVSFVSAPAQCKAVKVLLPDLSEEERSVVLRGRNAHTHGCPRGATQEEYNHATGLEALFGYLYLREDLPRIRSLFDECVRILLENRASL